MFKAIHRLADVQPAVAHKKEIRFQPQANGVTVGCYLFMDSATFDSPEALECRGIAFDQEGRICSRPLHKFFNLGEKAWLTADRLLQRDDLVAVFEKLDGSMMATAWVDGALHWRSKKSFQSDVVKLTQDFLRQPGQEHLVAFATEVASQGMTAIFELTHPQARIVVAQDKPQLRLLHVRDNATGQYVLLDEQHRIHAMLRQHGVTLAPRFTGMSLPQVLASLDAMAEQEGYVLQFANGDMVKLKCPWYLRLHRSITFLRERDIAVAALTEVLDDIKGALAESGVDMQPVLEVESRVKRRMVELTEEIEATVAKSRHLDRKSFAMEHKSHPLFGLMMAHYLGQEVDLKDWFIKNRLRQEFSLRVLADGALAEAMEG